MNPLQLRTHCARQYIKRKKLPIYCNILLISIHPNMLCFKFDRNLSHGSWWRQFTTITTERGHNSSELKRPLKVCVSVCCFAFCPNSRLTKQHHTHSQKGKKNEMRRFSPILSANLQHRKNCVKVAFIILMIKTVLMNSDICIWHHDYISLKRFHRLHIC